MPDTPEAVVHNWFEELWNQGREDTIDRLFAVDGIAHGLPTPDGSPLRGRDAFALSSGRFDPLSRTSELK